MIDLAVAIANHVTLMTMKARCFVACEFYSLFIYIVIIFPAASHNLITVLTTHRRQATTIATNIKTTNTTMALRTPKKSDRIVDDNVRTTMINTIPNRSAAENRKKQRRRNKMFKIFSKLGTQDVLEMNSEGTSAFIQIITLIEIITSSTRISSHTSF